MISYKPFLKLLIEKEMKKKELVERGALSWSTLSKINRGKLISLEVLDNLCQILECQPGDLIEYIPEVTNKAT